jgi:antitoxin component of MazEF toxin-antitoxin module
MQVAKWGNSLAIRIPAAVAEALELKAGDDVEVHVSDLKTFGIARKPSTKRRYLISPSWSQPDASSATNGCA